MDLFPLAFSPPPPLSHSHTLSLYLSCAFPSSFCSGRTDTWCAGDGGRIHMRVGAGRAGPGQSTSERMSSPLSGRKPLFFFSTFTPSGVSLLSFYAFLSRLTRPSIGSSTLPLFLSPPPRTLTSDVRSHLPLVWSLFPLTDNTHTHTRRPYYLGPSFLLSHSLALDRRRRLCALSDGCYLTSPTYTYPHTFKENRQQSITLSLLSP